MWSEFFSSVPEHLQLTTSLVKSTVLGSKADGNVRTYLGGFRRWKCWASSNRVCAFPSNPFQVAIYSQRLLREDNSPSAVLSAVYSIDWTQQMAGLSKISDHPLVSLMVSASQRLLGRPKVKEDPVTPKMLKALVESKITDKSPSISDRRSVALCLIGYADFFRFSELSLVSSISLESSKTDQFRDGAWIVIARSDLPICPVRALEEYISGAQIDLSEDLPLFRALATPWPKEMVRSQGISYTRAPELVTVAFRGLTDVSN